MSRHMQRWAAHRKDTMPQALAATLLSSVRSFRKLRPTHYFSAQVQSARAHSQCQLVGEYLNPKTCSTQPVLYSTFSRTISMQLLRSDAQAWALHHKQPSQRTFLKIGS